MGILAFSILSGREQNVKILYNSSDGKSSNSRSSIKLVGALVALGLERKNNQGRTPPISSTQQHRLRFVLILFLSTFVKMILTRYMQMEFNQTVRQLQLINGFAVRY